MIPWLNELTEGAFCTIELPGQPVILDRMTLMNIQFNEYAIQQSDFNYFGASNSVKYGTCCSIWYLMLLNLPFVIIGIYKLVLPANLGTYNPCLNDGCFLYSFRCILLISGKYVRTVMISPQGKYLECSISKCGQPRGVNFVYERIWEFHQQPTTALLS